MVFKIIFWFQLIVLFASLAMRVYWYLKDRYGYLSWFIEWIVMVISSIGIFSVAYDVPVFNQPFWWVTLIVVLASSFYRLQSKRFKEQMGQLKASQITFVKSLMFIVTLPILIGLYINAANLSGLW